MRNWSRRTRLYVIGAVVFAVVVGIIAVVGLASSGGGGSGSTGGGILGGNGNGGDKPALPSGDLGLSLKPNVSDSLGVDPSKGFVLTSGQDLSAAQVRAALQLNPAGAVNVEEQSKRAFKLTPMNPPPPDR